MRIEYRLTRLEKERNMTNVETTVNNPDVALEALNAFNAAEANLADAVYSADGVGFETREKIEDLLTEEDFIQEDPADGVVLN